eukprot:CAMPEP_0173177768 /NCGR_PEP_ID=MMETSP1141-20130122/5167_1 /TAXON_ID=483371 /ORGANISM="non described non described, Strain CCMP2298" /LENGTH=45 /DNA_ID= /DNA_START= /DNA_END= /DNA_ORIENTATION=
MAQQQEALLLPLQHLLAVLLRLLHLFRCPRPDGSPPALLFKHAPL